jgi:hypothetical protein
MGDVRFLAEQIERRPTDALIPTPATPALHTPEQVGQIAASMREFGWTYPVLVDEDDGIIAATAACWPPRSSSSRRCPSSWPAGGPRRRRGPMSWPTTSWR